MTAISDILDEADARRAGVVAERERLRALVARHTRKIEALRPISHVDVVRDLGERVAALIPGTRSTLFGPFGLWAECSFHLTDESGETVASASFRSSPEDDARPIMLGERTSTRHAAGTMGTVNGLNRQPRQMPATVEELAEEMRGEIARRRADAAEKGN